MPIINRQPDGTEGLDTEMMYNLPTTVVPTGDLAAGEGNNQATNVCRSLLRFSFLSDGTIPRGAIVVSCSLFLTAIADYSSNARTHRVYRSKIAWAEATACWNYYTGTTAWPGGAGGFGAADCEQTDIGSRAMTATETLNVEKEFVLTPAAIQEIVRGTFANNGFLLKGDTESDDMYAYASSDNATAAYRPRLYIVYNLPPSGMIIC
jgi:hypothetical protein